MKNVREWASKAQAPLLNSFLCSFVIRSSELESTTDHPFSPYRSTGENLYVKWQGRFSSQQTTQLNPPTTTQARLWSHSSHDLVLTPKPSPDSFYLGQGAILLWAVCMCDGERQGPWEGDLDPDVRGQLNMSSSVSIVQGHSYCINVYVNLPGAMNMTMISLH